MKWRRSRFAFLKPGELVDDDLALVLFQTYPGDAAWAFLPTYRFRMTHAGQDEEIGRIDLRVGEVNRNIFYGGHIGYSVDQAHRGRHYAARACRLLLPLARRHAMDEIWITCNPDNLASRRTCELAGAELIEIVDLPEDTDMYQRGERQKCRYRIDLSKP
jgi:predicted acetyltransferase